MDSKEDSGIDSDNKSASNLSFMSMLDANEVTEEKTLSLTSAKNIRTSDLQKKIEKRRDKNRKNEVVCNQPKKHSFLIPRSSEEDEFAVLHLSKEAQKEITEQLIKDGYDLDLEPDDDDLDLIPPRPLYERWSCCPSATWIPQCAIQ
ncbi:hypothetical protein ACF0H5_013352 [Mactra antiquata]